MIEWIKDSVPIELEPHKFLCDVLTSKKVVVLVKSKMDGNYPCIGAYTVHKDPNINIEHGHWSINGHNGNWDNKVIGWLPLPDI